ncbi:unnamed protein product, partial [Ectocarpus sp. 4 AP-2014]
KALLSCPIEDVEELICWHEDFDSREYTRSSQRHAATLEHGQREIRSIVGSVLLSQLRSTYHNHLAQVQGEQYLFALVLQAIRTRIEGGCGGMGCKNTGGGGGGGGDNRPSASSSCPACGRTADPACPMCGGTGVSLSELGFVDGHDKKAKTKSKKKRERKARARAAKKSQEEDDEAAAAAMEAAKTAAKAAKAAKVAKAKERSNGGQRANGHQETAGGRSHSQQQANKSGGSKTNGQQQQQQQQQRPKASGSKAKAATATAAAARQRAGSCGMESAGSLLSMLDDANGGANGGGGGRNDGDMLDYYEDGDSGIDEDIVREMERLKMQKARTDVQRSRAALRSNLQKNFDQLLVSSSSSSSSTAAYRETRGKA